MSKVNKERLVEFWAGFKSGPKELRLGLKNWWEELCYHDKEFLLILTLGGSLVLLLIVSLLSTQPPYTLCEKGEYLVQNRKEAPLDPFGSYQFSTPEVHVLYQKKPWKDTYDPVLLMTKEEAEQTCAEWIEPTGPPF